ncbi:hypothetical protein [Methanobrevibacter sp.]
MFTIVFSLKALQKKETVLILKKQLQISITVSSSIVLPNPE